jgi:hypothetical protein
MKDIKDNKTTANDTKLGNYERFENGYKIFLKY